MNEDQNDPLRIFQLWQQNKVKTKVFITCMLCSMHRFHFRLGSDSDHRLTFAKRRLSWSNQRRYSQLHQVNTLQVAGNPYGLFNLCRVLRSLSRRWYNHVPRAMLTNAMLISTKRASLECFDDVSAAHASSHLTRYSFILCFSLLTFQRYFGFSHSTLNALLSFYKN